MKKGKIIIEFEGTYIYDGKILKISFPDVSQDKFLICGLATLFTPSSRIKRGGVSSRKLNSVSQRAK